MKLLVLDIETVPNLGYFWGLWDQNIPINMIEIPGELLCFAAKWHGSNKTMFFKGDDMALAAYNLLDDADAVIHFNGKKFDIPWLNTSFKQAGLPKPSPFKQIDLLSVARSNFKLPSYKLQYVANWLKLGSKGDTGGFETWRGCMNGDAKAWAKMKKYNIQDVVLTEQVYDNLRPWISGHPNGNLYGEGGCPRCGADVLIKRGFAYTNVSKFQRYQCGLCDGYFRSTRRLEGVQLTEAK